MLRSLLFAPATRPDLVGKLPRSRPDAVIIDLEDAVPSAHKAAARPQAVAGASQLVGDADGPAVYVRVNAVDTPWFGEDMATALAPGITGIVVPKVESVAGLHAVREALRARGGPPLQIIAGFESGRGVLEVERVLAAAPGTDPVHACYFGAEDYTADIGARRTPKGTEVLYARSRVVLAAAVHGVIALDQVVVAIDDDEQFLADAAHGRDLGYRGKVCIHPGQVPLANRVFSPSEEELERSARMLKAWASGTQGGAGALLFEGRMIDEPAIREARALLAAADQSRAEPGGGERPA